MTRELPIPEIQTLCVLAHVSEARLTLRGHNEREIFALVAEGYLLAWNIALAPTQSARELRLLPESIERYAATGKKWHRDDAGLPVWKHLLLRGISKKEFLYCPTVALILNCKDTTVTNLIDAGHLSCLPRSDASRSDASRFYKRGPNGAACVPLASFLAFMKSRLEASAL